jgi:hypothetical protein
MPQRVRRKENESAKRFVPTIDQVGQAANSLPDPDESSDAKAYVPLEVHAKEFRLAFRRVKCAGPSGHSHHWIYEGKMLVR